jgi:hypothetical protein
MAGLRFSEIQTRPTEGLDVTSLTVDELQQVVPPFDAACQASMAHWRFDGQPRTARRYPTDKHCPLPTPEDRVLCILVYLKTDARQVVHGRLCGLPQHQAPQGMQVRLGILQATRRALGAAPTRSVQGLAQRLGVAAATAAAVVVPLPAPPTSAEPSAPVPTSPLVATRVPNGGSRVPRTRLNRRAVIAARRHAPR